jgi:hypothetical protein
VPLRTLSGIALFGSSKIHLRLIAQSGCNFLY